MYGNICGIDEAGRGPLAGDLVIAGCILDLHIDGLTDSKQLTHAKREKLYETIVKNSRYHIVVFSAKDIDGMGISACMTNGLKEIMQKLTCQEYIFDGNTAFGVKGLKTIVKADLSVPEVSAASILAKITHDANIVKDAKRYPVYEFEKHKGYATKRHIELIKEHGYCEIHRKSYKLKALEPTLFDM